MARRGEGGFSIIELMVAVGIFGICLAGLMALLTSSVKANASASDGANAIGLADGYLSLMRARVLSWTGQGDLSVEAPELNVDPDKWTVPITESGSAWVDGAPHDAEGRSVGEQNSRKAIYCIHYRTKWLSVSGAKGSSEEVEVTVRVAYTADSGEIWPDCAVATVDAALADGGTARSIIIPTFYRINPQ